MKLAISLGGSLLVPELPPSVPHFEAYANLITQLSEEGHDLVVVCGGGKLARALQIVHDAYNPFTDHVANQVKADELGIKATWENAALLAALLPKHADFEHKPHRELITKTRRSHLSTG